jgi:uncharacterized protein (TIGR02996 family)
LDTIIAHPHDDSPRLVYADWLEEQGECDRAEFIRLQIQLAHFGDDPWPPELETRAKSLWEEHRGEWRKRELPRRKDVRWPEWNGMVWEFAGYHWHDGYWRGFPVAVQVKDGETLAKKGANIFRVPAIRCLQFKEWRNLSQAADSPWLANLDYLDINYCHAGDEELSVLVHSPYLAQVRALGLGNNYLSVTAMRALANSPVLANVNSLDVRANPIQAAGMEVLGNSVHKLPRVTRLNLVKCELGDDGLHELLVSPLMKQLKMIYMGQNEFTDRGFRELAESPVVAGLERLEIGFHRTGVTEAAGEALLESPYLHKIKMLDARWCYCPSELRERLMQRYGSRLQFDPFWDDRANLRT